jgi:hypothetical protein
VYAWQTTDDSGKIIFVFSAEDSEYLLRNKTSFFLDGTFESCPRQFAQLHSLHVDLGSTSQKIYIHPVLFALLPDKKSYNISLFVNSAEELVFFLVINNYKGRF